MSQLKFSSLVFPEAERASAFQDVYASIANVDIQPYSQWPSYVDMVGQLLPNLEICEVTTTPHLSRRTRVHVAAENCDDLMLLVPIDGMAVISPENKNPIYCRPGEALLLPSDSVHQAYSEEPLSVVVINMPRVLIAPRVTDLGRRLMEKLSCASVPELHLLVGYVRILIQLEKELSPEIASLASMQIHDIAALILGAKRDEAEIAKERGLRALRLLAVKKDIQQHLTDSELSISQVARRQRISPQYIRALFQGEDTTFAEYVTGSRLEQIYRQLASLLYSNLSISTLAFDMGFNNLSWFNRAFKQRFGLTPSEIRAMYL